MVKNWIDVWKFSCQRKFFVKFLQNKYKSKNDELRSYEQGSAFENKNWIVSYPDRIIIILYHMI